MIRLENSGDLRLEATYELIDAINLLNEKMDLNNSKLDELKELTATK